MLSDDEYYENWFGKYYLKKTNKKNPCLINANANPKNSLIICITHLHIPAKCIQVYKIKQFSFQSFIEKEKYYFRLFKLELYNKS